jgi:uncharacterized protein YjiS (DUF1127 family)
MSYDLSIPVHTAQVQAQAGIVARYLENWRARKAVRKLQELDPHLLKDLGLLRTDVTWASELPLSINAALALEEVSRRNRVMKW